MCGGTSGVPLRGEVHPLRHRRIRLEPIDHGHAGAELALEDLLRRQAVEHHHQRAQRIAVCRHQHALAAQHARLDLLDVVGQHACRGILQAFAAGRRDVVGAAPDMHLLSAPLLARVVLVEARELAVVALVERLVLEHRNRFLPEFVEHEVEGALRALEGRRERHVELQALALELASGGARLVDAALGEIDIAPAGEQVLLVPLAFAMAHEDEKMFSHCAVPQVPGCQKSVRPSTSAIEYRPGLRPRAHCAARRAPRAKIMRSSARCTSSMRSAGPANMTLCSPTTVPPRSAAKPMAPFSRAPVWPSRLFTACWSRSMARPSAAARPSRSAVPDGASTFVL